MPYEHICFCLNLHCIWGSMKHVFTSRYDVGENGAISLDYVGESWLYPNATLSQRKDIVDSHVEYVGL